MTRLTAAVGTIACLAFGTAIAGAETRFAATDQSVIAGIPGLRIISVRDTRFELCYLVFLAEPAGGRNAGEHVVPDVGQARARRDERLADLLSGFEKERGAVPGTIAPNPLRYEWPAFSAQLEFVVVALQYEFMLLEQQMDRVAEPSRMAVTAIPAPCAPVGARAAP